jgi:hypothetical protein
VWPNLTSKDSVCESLIMFFKMKQNSLVFKGIICE